MLLYISRYKLKSINEFERSVEFDIKLITTVTACFASKQHKTQN